MTDYFVWNADLELARKNLFECVKRKQSEIIKELRE